MRQDFFGYTLQKMIDDKVIELHTEGEAFTRMAEANADEGKVRSYAKYSDRMKVLLDSKSTKTYMDQLFWSSKCFQDLFILKDKKRAFLDAFELYALAATVELRMLDKDLDGPLNDGAKELKEKAYKVKISEINPKDFSNILAYCAAEQMKIQSSMVVNYALSQLKAAQGIAEAPDSVKVSNSVSIETSMSAIFSGIETDVMNQRIIPQVNFYLLVAVIEAKLAGYIFTDGTKPIVRAADILIAEIKFAEAMHFNYILKTVDTYIVKNFSTLDLDVIKAAPEVLFLPLPQSLADYYNHFKINTKALSKTFTKDSVPLLLNRFKGLLAQLIVHQFSEEEIMKAHLSVGDGRAFEKSFDEIYLALNGLDLKKDKERAKIVCNSLTKCDRLIGFFRFLDAKGDEGLAKMLALIEGEILDTGKIGAVILSFIARKPSITAECYNKYPKFFEAFIRHISEFDTNYDILVNAIIKMNPACLELVHPDIIRKGDFDVKKYGKYLVKNGAYLNWLAEENEVEALFKILELQQYPSEALALINPKHFIVLSKLFDKEFKRSQEPGFLDSFRKHPLLPNFQDAVKQCFGYIKELGDLDGVADYPLLTYVMCADKELQAEIENFIACVGTDKAPDKDSIMAMLKVKIEFFERLKVETVCEIIKKLEKNDKDLLSAILKKYPDRILGEETSCNQIIKAAEEYYYCDDEYKNLILFKLYEAAEDKAAFWAKFSPNQLKTLVVVFEKELDKITGYKDLPIHFASYFTAKELLDLESIKFIHKIATSNPKYIEGELEIQIQYYFLTSNLDIVHVKEDTVDKLVQHIHAQPYDRYNEHDAVRLFRDTHRLKFEILELRDEQKVATAQAELEQIKITDRIEKTKLGNAYAEVAFMDSKQRVIQTSELRELERPQREEEQRFLLEKLRVKEEFKLKAQVDAENTRKLKLENDALQLTALRAKTKAEEELKHQAQVNAEVIKKQRLKIEALELTALRAKTSMALYEDYKAARDKKQPYVDYKNLTHEQQVGLVLKIAEKAEIGRNESDNNKYFRSTIEDNAMFIEAANRAPSHSVALCNLLAIANKEVVSDAINKFKISAATAGWVLDNIRGHIKDDRKLKVLFNQGPEAPVGALVDCIAYGLIGLSFCAYNFYLDRSAPVKLLASSVGVLAHALVMKEKRALLCATTAFAVLAWESKNLAAGVCLLSLAIHAKDFYEHAEYKFASISAKSGDVRAL